MISAIFPLSAALNERCLGDDDAVPPSNLDQEMCNEHLNAIANTQLKVLPVIIYALSFGISVVLVLCGLQHYTAVSIPKKTKSKQIRTSSKLTEDNIQTLLTALWFIVYYFPTVLLILIVDSKNSPENEGTVQSTRGIIKLALILRILNVMANFFMNALANGSFRQELFTPIYRNVESVNADKEQSAAGQCCSKNL